MSTEETTYLNLSDEAIMEMGEPTFAEPAPVDEPDEEGQDLPEGEAVGEESDGPSEDGDDEPSTEEDPTDDETEEEEDGAGSEEEEPEEGDDPGKVAQNFFDVVTAPFKANGREMRVDNPQDVVRLMQMGANYNKKMAALKPSMKMLKMLENNELLNEEKLSFLIDLNKKNPAAIAKLVKDAGIDPLDLDQDGSDEYKPNSYTVDERELALDEVISEIKETDAFSKTMDVVSTKWDSKSKQTIADAPQLLKVINDHVASGVYDVISQEVDRKRMLGELVGLSDIEAYRQVGDAIEARGGFAHLFKQQPDPKTKVVVAAKTKPSDELLDKKRRAASPPKRNVASKPIADFDPLALSDEEFEKLTLDKFL